MSGSSNLLRSLVVYALVLPLALIIGYTMANPMDKGTLILLALVLSMLSLPVLLKHHRPILFLFWNTTAVIFFLPGRPQVWIALAFLSLGIVVLQKALIRDFHFPDIRSLLAPVVFIAAVVLITAKLRGGFGLAAFGDSIGGGRRYFTMFAGMAGFVAMASAKAPPHRAVLFVGLFFLGSIMNAIGALANWVTPALYWIFWVFPVDALPGQEAAVWRSSGVTAAGMGIYLFLLSRYGLKGILFSGRPIRLLLLIGVVSLTMTGGYRSFFVLMVLTGLVLAYLEGLFTSKYVLALLAAGILGFALLIPTASRLPLSIQRTLSVLPIDVSYEASENARVSNEWRLKMWETLLPDVPRYFWLGKGLAVDVQELVMARDIAALDVNRGDEAAKMAGDFHNGPLTVLINFGVWGAIGWLWFVAASVRALYRNYKFGADSLKKINALLLAYLVGRILLYFLIYGNFYTDLPVFLGIVGLSVALNGGIATKSSSLRETSDSTLAPARETLSAV